MNDQRNGDGVTFWRDGDRNAGSMREGAMKGPGVYRFAGGRRYEGDHERGLPSGHGVRWAPDGGVAAS